MNDRINSSVFALYRYYSDGSGKPDMIYIGDDKAAAFDALMAFGKATYFDSGNLQIAYHLDPALPEIPDA